MDPIAYRPPDRSKYLLEDEVPGVDDATLSPHCLGCFMDKLHLGGPLRAPRQSYDTGKENGQPSACHDWLLSRLPAWSAGSRAANVIPRTYSGAGEKAEGQLAVTEPLRPQARLGVRRRMQLRLSRRPQGKRPRSLSRHCPEIGPVTQEGAGTKEKGDGQRPSPWKTGSGAVCPGPG